MKRKKKIESDLEKRIRDHSGKNLGKNKVNQDSGGSATVADLQRRRSHKGGATTKVELRRQQVWEGDRSMREMDLQL